MSIGDAKKAVSAEISSQRSKLDDERKRISYCMERGINADFHGYTTMAVELYMLESFMNLLETGEWK